MSQNDTKGRGPDKKPRKPRVATPSMRLNLRLPPEEVIWLRAVSGHKVSEFILVLVRSEMKRTVLLSKKG